MTWSRFADFRQKKTELFNERRKSLLYCRCMTMIRQQIFPGFLIVFALLLPALALGQNGQQDSSIPEQSESTSVYQDENPYVWSWQRPLGFRRYWKNGLHFDNDRRRLKLKFGGKMLFDAGVVTADSELETTFPNLDGPANNLRALRLSFQGTWRETMAFKLELDISDRQEVRDNWFEFNDVRFLGSLRFGHQREPFSLSTMTGIKNVTFMEKSLPTNALAPSRNFGIKARDTALNKKVTWAVGTFFNTGTLDNVTNPQDAIGEANGWNITGRFVYRPWYEDEGSRLLHLGLSYSHQFRNAGETRASSRPESNISGDRLVDTGEIVLDGGDLLCLEYAYVSGSLSLQGEIYLTSMDAPDLDNPYFWGFYVYASYFLTGEHRNYNRKRGAFVSIHPEKEFDPFAEDWGAVEIAARLSHVDLSSGKVRGGQETNVTAGLNWYLSRVIRITVNYINLSVKDRAMPKVEHGRAHIMQTRFQIAF